MTFSIEGLNEAREFAETIGLSCYVHAGRIYVMDGGTRGNRGHPGWDTESSSTSSREATEQECDLWRALGGDA